MALVKITFDSASVTSKQDADLNHFLANRQNGRVAYVLNAATPSTSNNYISFASGYLQVYGRRAYVEPGTKIAVSLDGSAYGYVYAAFDISSNTLTLAKRESSSGWPALTQQDLMNGGSLYELPLARYTKTTSALNLDLSYSAPLIMPASYIASTEATGAVNTCASRYGPVYQERGTLAYGTTWMFTKVTTATASSGICCVYVSGALVWFPTDAYKASGGMVSYYYDGEERTITVQLTDNALYVEASNGSEPKYVRVIR